MKLHWVLAAKDLRLLVRDKMGAFFTFFFPLIYCIFFGMIFSKHSSEKMTVAIVDEDQSSGSKQYVETLSASDELDVIETDRANAESAVARGKAVAYLVLPKGFGEGRDRMFFGPSEDMELGIDPARKAETGMLQGVLMRHAFEGMQELFTNRTKMRHRISDWTSEVRSDSEIDPGAKSALLLFFPALDGLMASLPTEAGKSDSSSPDSNEKVSAEGWMPMRFRTRDVAATAAGGPPSAFAVSFPQGMMWGIIGCTAAFGISMVLERTRGTLVRLQSAPISRGQVLVGKALACFIANIGLLVLLLLIAIIIFNVRPRSFLLLFPAIISTSAAFVGIMMLLSVMGKTEQSVAGIGWAVLLIMAMIGGGMIPLFAMPEFMITLSNFSPVKWGIYAIECAIWRPVSLWEALQPCGILLAIGGVCLALGTRLFSWSTSGKG